LIGQRRSLDDEFAEERIMTEVEQFADTLQRAFDGESWQGGSLSELLGGVTAEQAKKRPLPQAHGIWELVLHIGVWHRVVQRRMQGEAVLPAGNDNFPERGQTEAEWQQAVEALRKSTRETADAIRRFPASRLDEQVPGKNYPYRHMLSGVSTHDAYHAGQIALLKKAL
jgi:uncharacterized damage-inducible protein DinB